MSKPVVLLDAGELVALSGANDGDVLTWNGTLEQWQSSPGGGVGTVTSVSLSTASTGLTVSGSTSQTITGAGTFTLGGILGAGYGGTGLGAPASGDAGKVLTATSSGGYELTIPAAGGVTSITAGAGLLGGTITSTGTISMPNVGSAGTYGSASSVAVITTDEQGRVSSATTTSISVTQSQVQGLTTALGGKADKTVSATAGTGLTGGGTLASDFSFALDTVGTAQTNLGSASKTVTISTDVYGRVTSLSEQDISGLAASVITSGQIGLARGGTGLDTSGVTAGQVLVGGSGSFALQSISGDATLASSGAMAVTKLQGNPVASTLLGAPDAGKALVWSGSEWQASTIQGGGGGGGLTFFMNYAASSPYPMSPQFDENAGWDTGAIVVANDANGTALGTFVTAVGSPAIEVIPAGLWDVNFYAQSSDGVNSTAVRVKVATLAGATQTVIATSDWVYLSDPSAVVGYSASVYVPLTDVSLTDRVEIIFEGRRFVSASQSITLHFGTDSITHAHTTINAPGGTGLVKVVDGFLQSPASLLVNADVDDAAAIAVSKLAAGTNNYVLTTVAGVPTWSAPPATGVTSLTGTADQVLVNGTSGSPQTGALTLTLPQSIGTGSSPTFAGLTVGSLSGLLRATAGVLSGGATVALGSEVSGTLPVANGGTGLTSSGASGNLLVSDGSAFASVAMTGDATINSTGALTLKNTGSAGTYGSASAVPVFVTDAQGRVTSATNTSISITASQVSDLATSAVTSLTGTTDQVNVSSSTGAVTLSLPQSIAATSSPTFAGATLTGLTGYLKGNGSSALTASASVPTSDLSGTIDLTSQVSGVLPVANGGTGAATTQANKVLAGPTSGLDAAPSFRALVPADVAGITPYDFMVRFPGAPGTSTVLAGWVMDRAVTIPSVANGGAHQFYIATVSASGSDTLTLTIKQNGSSIGTAVFTGGTSAGANGLIAATSITFASDVTLAASDYLTIETQSGAFSASFATILCTLFGKA